MNRLWKYFQCQQCGACCTTIGLPYDAESAVAIAGFLKLTVEELIETYYGNLSHDRLSWLTDDAKRIPCPFLKKSAEKYFCEIYAVRPQGCRLYPIDTDGGRNGVVCPAWGIAYSNLKKEQEEEI